MFSTFLAPIETGWWAGGGCANITDEQHSDEQNKLHKGLFFFQKRKKCGKMWPAHSIIINLKKKKKVQIQLVQPEVFSHSCDFFSCSLRENARGELVNKSRLSDAFLFQ